MTDAQKLIAETLAGIFATWITRDGVEQIIVDGDYDGITGRPIEEVAAEIDKALGGLWYEETETLRPGGGKVLRTTSSRWVSEGSKSC